MLTPLPPCGVMTADDMKDRIDKLVQVDTLYDGIKSLPQIEGVALNVKGFYAGTDVGGGQFFYDPSRSKTEHNGGTVIAPAALTAWDGTSGDIATLLDWTGAGSGCFVRLFNIQGVAHSSEFGFLAGDATKILENIKNNTDIYEVVFDSDFSTSVNLDFGGKKISSSTDKVVASGSGLKNCVLSGVFKRSKPDFVSIKSPSQPDQSTDIKMLIRRNSKAAYVMQQNNQGYIRTVIEDGIFTTVDSAGSPSELIRATIVDAFHEVWVGHGVATTVSGVTPTVETFGGSIYSRLSAYGQSHASSFDKGAGLSKYFLTTNGAFVEYEGLEPIDGCVNLMIQTSSTTAFPNNFAVTIDGVEVTLPSAVTVSPSAGAGLLRYKIPVEFSSVVGSAPRKLRVTHSGATGTDKVNIIGCNMFKLSELKEPLNNANWFAAFAIGASYTNTKGATDYAIYDSDDNQWIGSYHGGETRSSYKVEVNGSLYDYENALFEDFVMGSQIRLQQSTNINSKLNTYQYIDWSTFGGYSLQVSMDGSVNCTDFFTCMSTSNPRFDLLEFPQYTDTSVAGDYDVGNNDNLVVQCASDNSDQYDLRKQSNQFTFFKTGDTDYNGAYIASSTIYNKLYYGPVFDGISNVNKIGFMTVKKFY